MISINNDKDLQKNITRACHVHGLKRKNVLRALRIRVNKRDLTVSEVYKISKFLGMTIHEMLEKPTP